MSQDAAYEMALGLAEEARHHGECVVCGLDGEYGAGLCECPLCGAPVHEWTCEETHYDRHKNEDEEEDQ